jgi:hypothetical protein
MCVLLFSLKEIVPLLDRLTWLGACLHGTKKNIFAQPNPGSSTHIFSFKRKEMFSPILQFHIKPLFFLNDLQNTKAPKLTKNIRK